MNLMQINNSEILDIVNKRCNGNLIIETEEILEEKAMLLALIVTETVMEITMIMEITETMVTTEIMVIMEIMEIGKTETEIMEIVIETMVVMVMVRAELATVTMKMSQATLSLETKIT
jgi:hypothetical protein